MQSNRSVQTATAFLSLLPVCLFFYVMQHRDGISFRIPWAVVHTAARKLDANDTGTLRSNGSSLAPEVSRPHRTIPTGLCRKCGTTGHPSRCVMSHELKGRLGNSMGQYATLYALARWNDRPALQLPEMADRLRRYFRVSMPALDDDDEDDATVCLRQGNWSKFALHDWMEEAYRSLPVDPGQPLLLTGYSNSWTFYQHLRHEIRGEFRLRDRLQERAWRRLRALLGNRTSSVTYVGVHVRRTDYVVHMAGDYGGVVADAGYLSRAIDHFRSRYSDAVFVVASDDMAWCRANIDAGRGDVHFAGSGATDDAIGDLALLSSCNHSVITLGTYGYWSAYLAGGEVVRMGDFLLAESAFLRRHPYRYFYPPHWTAISVGLTNR